MRIILVILTILFVTPLISEENWKDILKECSAIEETTDRLECFDGFVASQIEIGPLEDNKITNVMKKLDQIKTLVEALKFNEAISLIPETLSEDLKKELITLIVSKVKPLPARKTQLNYEGYLLLTKLEPTNVSFQKKRDRYKTKLTAEKTKFLKKLRSKTDDFKNVTFYSHPNQPRYTWSRSTIYLYIGDRPTSKPWLRLKTQYTASDWLFVESAKVNIDGEIFIWTNPTSYSGFERDNGSGDIWEWYDESPSQLQLSLLKKMGEASKVTIRFEGSQYYDDKVIPRSDLKAIKEILLAYDEMIEQGM